MTLISSSFDGSDTAPVNTVSLTNGSDENGTQNPDHSADKPHELQVWYEFGSFGELKIAPAINPSPPSHPSEWLMILSRAGT